MRTIAPGDTSALLPVGEVPESEMRPGSPTVGITPCLPDRPADRSAYPTAMETAVKVWTDEELMALPKDGGKRELLNGEIIMSPAVRSTDTFQ